jgi:hypothetical protein
MKKIAMMFLFLCAFNFAGAQCNDFYPIKEGLRYEYDHFDKKEKVTMHTVSTFKNVSGSGDNLKATLVQEATDVKKNQSLGTTESEWICENGVLHFTMNTMSMIDNGQQGGDPGMKVAVTGDKMDVPPNLKVGQTLKDMNYNITMTMAAMTIMNRDFKLRNRKVEKEETVTTPAGTFPCLKITFTTTSEKGLGSGTIQSAMWFAKDVGLVKSENYKEDGKLMNRQVLTKIVR